MTNLFWMFSPIWAFHGKVSFCKFPVRCPQSPKLSCHSTTIKVNVSVPFCFVNRYLRLGLSRQQASWNYSNSHKTCSSEAMAAPTGVEWSNWNDFPELFIHSAATPLLADTQRFRSSSPSSKPKFHLKVTTFQFYILLKEKFWADAAGKQD